MSKATEQKNLVVVDGMECIEEVMIIDNTETKLSKLGNVWYRLLELERTHSIQAKTQLFMDTFKILPKDLENIIKRLLKIVVNFELETTKNGKQIIAVSAIEKTYKLLGLSLGIVKQAELYASKMASKQKQLSKQDIVIILLMAVRAYRDIEPKTFKEISIFNR